MIPTLNRAHLLRSSLKSATEQTFPDLEVVVFDDMSDDDTASVAASFASPRVRYVRANRRFDMSESFEEALKHATGEHVTFLTDDSYLLPHAVSRAFRALTQHTASLVAWRHAGYFDEHWVEPRRRNTLYVPRTSNRARLLSSRQQLTKWFRHLQGHSEWMPRSINSLCRRSIIEAAIRAQGRFFLPPAPDHSSGVAMLMNSSEYVALDAPLVIDGVTKESIGPAQSFTRGKSAEDFYRTLGPTLAEATYLGMPTTSAIIAKSFEKAAAFYPDAPSIDPRTVLTYINDDLAKLSVYGTDVSGLLDVLDHKASEYGRAFCLSLQASRARSTAKWLGVKFTRSSRWAPALETVRGLTTIRGDTAGFDDVEGAARALLTASPVADQV